MDEQVIRSMLKWPDVPDCFGWLALDRRGQWRMRNEYAQLHHLPGTPIEHTGLKEYISRNYTHDALGRYYFQNGPQKVFVTLDSCPWVVRMQPSSNYPNAFTLVTQCGSLLDPHGALSDEAGNIYIVGTVAEDQAISVALLHDHDLTPFSEQSAIEEDACSYRGSWKWGDKKLPIDPITSSQLSSRYHFVKTPS